MASTGAHIAESASKKMRESDIEIYLVKRVKELGGEVRKVKWIGRNKAPDRRVMLNGLCVWIELKAPGKVCREGQTREHARMRKHGEIVEVVDSIARIDEILSHA